MMNRIDPRNRWGHYCFHRYMFTILHTFMWKVILQLAPDGQCDCWHCSRSLNCSRIVTESVMLMDVDSLNLASIFNILDDLYVMLETYWMVCCVPGFCMLVVVTSNSCSDLFVSHADLLAWFVLVFGFVDGSQRNYSIVV